MKPLKKPILILDADEVLLHFLRHLEGFLGDEGFHLHLESFALSGNIRHAHTGAPASDDQVKHLIVRFFESRIDDVPLVDGAVAGVRRLKRSFEPVVLTNVPDHLGPRRAASLKAAGLDVPVITGSGAKGPGVARLAEGGRPVVFVDDLPPNHQSVATHVPHSHRIQMIADRRLAALVGPAPHSHHRIDRWDALVDHLEARAEGAADTGTGQP
ncbi:hypothetical protein [Yunchengibacter salinarum]|uniref:hypothetical protein n=1 Tax=Yunchengibacter salinarum TaxID=3133399 RepID=UPI0035B5C9C0